MKLDKDKLIEIFKDQISLLKSGIKRFDAGEIEAYLDLTNRIVVICHDGGRNYESLLSALDIKDNISPRSFRIGLPESEPSLTKSPCTIVSMQSKGSEIKLLPNFLLPEGAPIVGQLSFDKWWHEPILFLQDGTSKSRNELTFHIRNKFGGSHLDTSIKEKDAWFYQFRYEHSHGVHSIENGIGFSVPPKGTDVRDFLEENEEFVTGWEKFAVRQIAEELLEECESNPIN